MDKKIFIINGPAGAGKDTFVSMVGSLVPSVNYSSVVLVKEAAKILGWEGGKDDKDRKFLSDLKDLSTAYSSAIFKDILERAERFRNDDINEFMFIHIREIPEISTLAKVLDAKTILITRIGVDPNKSNTADANVLNYDYDIIIHNDGTLGEFKLKAEEFVRNLQYVG